MSKRKNKMFTYTPLQKLPKLGNIKTEWNLKKHYYASEKDPRIERDLKKAERAYASFAKKYNGKNFTRTSRKLLAALKDYETLIALSAATAPSYYFGYRHAKNARDSVAEKRLNLIEQRMTKACNRVLFFELALGKIPRKLQRAYVADPALAPYRYYLERVFLESRHMLSEAEERILNLKAQTSAMWPSGTEKIISNRTIAWKGRTVALPEALEIIDTQPPKQKQKLWNLITDELAQIAEVAENEFNAIVTDKKISDGLRNYPQPYSRTIQSYENNERSVLSLIEAISTKGFQLSRRFYKLKAKHHGVAALPYVNKYDPIGHSPYIPYKQAVEICRDAFYTVKNTYGEIFDRMLENGQIDAYPRRGKRGGAFMSGTIGHPTFVFLNHVDNFKSLNTLAHEMGHAIHTERSKGQPPRYQGYSITTAETASTLFEQIVDNAILRQSSAKDRLVLLHDRIGRDIATIQRQAAFFNFEWELHTSIRTHGATTKEELQKLMQKHLKSYLGGGVEVTLKDAWSYVYVSHFRYGFYVYTYAYGLLMSRIMAKRLEQDPRYVTNIDAFLTAGGSDTVENIFKSVGIDAGKTKTFTESLSSLEEDINEFERLIESSGKIKP